MSDATDPESKLTDPVDRSDALDESLRLISTGELRLLRWVLWSFATLIALMGIGSMSAYLNLREVTSSTEGVVKRDIPRLEAQLEDRDEAIADYDVVVRDATDAIVQLLELLRANGIEPPNIVIRPPPKVDED